jgi:thermitase
MFVALLVPSSAWAADPTARIIVQHEPGLTTSEQAEIRSDVDATLVDTLKVPRTEVIAVDQHDLKSALRHLNRDPGVAIAEEDRVIHAFSNDPDFTRLWGLENTGQTVFQTDGSTYAALANVDMNIPEAWEMSLGTGRTVAVVDSGVLATHSDLVGRIAPGYDWVDEDKVPNDSDGHGTHVTGTLAATVNNGKGIAGVAPQSRVLPLRVLDANGAGFLSDIIDAFQFAGQQGVRVVNASLGGSTFSTLEKQAIDQHPDTLFVVAAGNSGKDVDASGNAEYPCNFTSPNVLCVGAHWARDGRAWYSNYGRQSVDVYAPGTGIYSTSNNNTNSYVYESGTSMAAPHVAGVAALLLARNPSLSTAQVKAAILNTVRRTSSSYVSTSSGRVNAEAAVGSVFADRDGDNVQDDDDNCPDVPNTDQTDSTPGDGTGDACEEGAPPVNADNDGVVFNDACPQEPGAVSAQGCPGAATDSNHDGVPDMFDSDRDSVVNARDNCPTRSNRDQADADRDRIGNVCDSTPRGPDADGDGRPLLDDKCPTVYAKTSTGCPAAPVIKDSDGDGRKDNVDACPYEKAVGTLNGCPLPAVTALSAKSRKRGGKRYAAITVRTSRGASARIVVYRKKGKRWVKIMSRTRVTSSKNRVSLNTKRLKRGRYRVVVQLSSAAGSAAKVTKAFRVR